MSRKRYLIIMLVALCSISSVAQEFKIDRKKTLLEGLFIHKTPVSDQTYMSIENFTIAAGESKTVTVYLHSVQPIWMLQCYFNLPDGFTASGARLTDSFKSLINYDEGFGVISSSYGNQYRVIVSNTAKNTFIPAVDNQSVLTITITASSSIHAGEYVLSTSEFKFVDASTYMGEGYIGANTSCNITVSPIKATSVTLNKVNATLYPNETLQLTATVLPTNTTNKAVTWESSNTSVATVDNNGMVTANSVGNATITVTTADGSNKRATCDITVNPILATSVSLNKSSASLYPEQTLQLTATVLPTNTTNKAVTWESSNTSVATVDNNGMVTANSVGNATITVTTADGSNKRATCDITVNPILATSVSLNKSSASLYPEQTLQLTATVLPTNTTNKAVTWESSNTSVATVDNNGMVTANSVGNATITVTTADGSNKRATCVITVNPILATSVTLNQSNAFLYPNETLQLMANVLPTNVTNNSVTWKSSNTSVASVDNNGMVTAKIVGNATITVTTADGSNKSATCSITVNPILVNSVTLNMTDTTLYYYGETIQLAATVLPTNATNKGVTWNSSNTSVATVDNNGKVTAKTTGITTITATTTDGSNITAYCQVNVHLLVRHVALNKTYTTLYIGNTETLVATVTPSDAYNNTLSWTSSNPSVATVDENGMIRAISVGTATITASTTDGSNLSASCTVTVKAYVESISLDNTNIELYTNDYIQLNATIFPDYASNKSLSWYSSNSSVATVTSNGVVKGIKPGNATITVKATDGSNVTATCEVTVIQDYALIVQPLQHVRGDAQCYMSYPIELINNKSAISALQFDMTLPTGLSMAMKNGYPDVWLDDARKTRTHSVEANPIGTNKYRFIVSSTMNKDLIGNSGDLVHMNLRFDTIHPAGTYYIYLNNIILTESNETQHTASNTSSMVSLKYLLGDANADFSVDAADYVATAAKILSKPVPIFYSDAANVNGDNSVNVTDLVGITNIALGIRPTEVRPAPSIGNDGVNSIPSIRCISSDCNTQLAIAVENSQALAGLQMDLSLPTSISVTGAELVGRAAKQQLNISNLPNGKTRLLISSFSDNDIAVGNDEILLVSLQGVADQSDAVLDSIYAVERDMNTYELEPLAIQLGTTGVSAVMAHDHVKIYSDGRHIVIESPTNGTAQLVLLNGITRQMPVKAGRNTYPMEPGYYIVRMYGQTTKIRL